MTATDMIWDGVEFSHVSRAEAKALVKADKAQILDSTVDGLGLKFRNEFTGYDVKKELVMPPMKAATPTGKPDMTKTMTYAEWRKAAAEALNKPFKTVTKQDVDTFKKGQ